MTHRSSFYWSKYRSNRIVKKQ